jgi:competence protein ComEA
MDRTVPDWHAIDEAARPPETTADRRLDPILVAVVAIVVLATIAVIGIGWLLIASSPSPEVALEDPTETSQAAAAATEDRRAPAVPGASPSDRAFASAAPVIVVVDVEGAVTRPGVYRLASDTRVGDAIAAAGGYAPTADAIAASLTLNLAERLVDGAKIRVPVRGETTPAPATSPGTGAQPGSRPQPTAAGPVDLNHATREELEALPGVGPVTASEIIAAREQEPFTSIDELRGRGIVGEKTFEKLRPLVTVGP